MSELPIGWAETTLAQLVSPDRPRELPRDLPHLPFVGMEHVEAHSMRLIDTVPASGLKSSAVHFQAGDVLYGRLRPYLNKVLLARFEGLCSAEFIVFGKRAEVSSEWLAYFLNSSGFVSFSSHLNAGDRPRVDFDQIGSYELLVAPRQEQDRIVAEIDKQFTRLDAATTALKRVQANLKRYRASVLKAACEGRLVPTEAELARKEGRDYEPADKLLQRILRERRARWEADTLAKMQASGKSPKDDHWKQKYKEPAVPDTSSLRPLPEGWCWASADQICSQITDGEHIQPPYRDSGRPLLTAKHVQDGWVDFRDFGLIDEESFAKARARCAPIKGDVLIVSVGATTGRTGIVREEPSFAIVRSVLLLRPIVNSRYLLTWAQSPSCQDWIRSASGSTAQAHFYINDAKRMPVALAPEMEQQSIADEKDRMLSVLDALQAALLNKVKASASLRQAILRHAFAGQLVPQDPTDEPASALLERIRAERGVSGLQKPARSIRKEPAHA
jgi:type I restriction enzyme, S subunit